MASRRTAGGEAQSNRAKGKRGKPTLLERLASIELPMHAWGLTRRRSAGVDERADVLLALGFPHMLLVVDEPMGTTEPAKFTKLYASARVVPREALGRLWALTNAGPDPAARAAAITSEPGAVDYAEVFRQRVKYSNGQHVRLLEALIGPDAATRAIVDTLVELPPSEWNGGKIENYGYALVHALWGPLLRVSPPTRDELRGKLVAKLDELRSAGGLWRAGKALDVILNGRAGVERSGRGFGGKLFLSELAYAEDDPRWVRDYVLETLATLRPADRAYVDAQVALAGGPDVVAALRGSLDKFLEANRADLEEQLTLFA